MLKGWQLGCQSLFLGVSVVRVVAPICWVSWVIFVRVVGNAIYIFRTNICNYIFFGNYITSFEDIVWRYMRIGDFDIAIFDGYCISDLLLEIRRRLLFLRYMNRLVCFLRQQCLFLNGKMRLLLLGKFYDQIEKWCCDFQEEANRILMWSYLKK